MSDITDRLDHDTITWQCPHCKEATSDSEHGIRVHINQLDDDPHEGTSGWDLDYHVPGYDSDGHLVAAIQSNTDHHAEDAIIPAKRIRNANWHHEFVTPPEPTPAERNSEEETPDEGIPEETPSSTSPDPSQLASDEDSFSSDEVRIPVNALDEIQTILAHYREAGKRAERLANPGSVPAARAQARWYTAGRFIEILDSLHEDTDERPAQAGHDREL